MTYISMLTPETVIPVLLDLSKVFDRSILIAHLHSGVGIGGANLSL